MIIFDLDGTLADCEHRRRFVDHRKVPYTVMDGSLFRLYPKYYDQQTDTCIIPCDTKWKPDWKSFYEACDKDEPIKEVTLQFYALVERFGIKYIHIWSGRCESIKEKTIKWITKYLSTEFDHRTHLKMRPIGDSTPYYELKEKWLNERCHQQEVFCGEREVHDIEFVFDSDPESIKMWRDRGIFVFNCAQQDGEF